MRERNNGILALLRKNGILILFDNRSWVKGWHINREIQWNVKHSLVSSSFCLCFYFNSHQKGAHLYKSGATQGSATSVCGEVAPNCPPWIRHWINVTVPIKVSNALQRIYREIDSEINFLSFEAADMWPSGKKFGDRWFSRTMFSDK